MEPSYEIIKHLKEAGYVTDICHANDDDTAIKASRILGKDLGLSEYEGVIALDGGGDDDSAAALAKKADAQGLVVGGYGKGALLVGKAGLLKDIPVCSGLPSEFYKDAEEVDAPSVRAGNIVTSAGNCAIGFAVLLVDALGGEVKNVVKSANDDPVEEASAVIIGPVSNWPAYWPMAREMMSSHKSLVMSDPKWIDIKTSSLSGFVFGQNDILPVQDMPIPHFAWIRDDRLLHDDLVLMAEGLEKAGCRGMNSARAIGELDSRTCRDAIEALAPKRVPYGPGMLGTVGGRRIRRLVSGIKEVVVRDRGDRYLVSHDRQNFLAGEDDVKKLVEAKFGGRDVMVEQDVRRARLGDSTYSFEWIMVRTDDGWVPCLKLAASDDEVHFAPDVIRLIFPDDPGDMEDKFDEMASMVAMVIQSLVTNPEDLGEMSIVMVTDDDQVLVRGVSPVTSMRLPSRICERRVASSFGTVIDKARTCRRHPHADDPNHVYVVERELANEGIWLQPNGEIIVDGHDGPHRTRDIQELITDLKYEAIQSLEREMELQDDDDQSAKEMAGRKSRRTRHRLRMAFEMEFMLVAKRKKLAGTYHSSVAGPYSNLEMSMHERVFPWQEGDDWLADRDKAISDLPRYNPEYEKMNPNDSEGFYYVWEEERREPTDWLDILSGEDTAYPIRSILKK
jgi:hypothetical protein